MEVAMRCLYNQDYDYESYDEDEGMKCYSRRIKRSARPCRTSGLKKRAGSQPKKTSTRVRYNMEVTSR